jgi:L-ascorbate metabolism protein UlaG (beta-lactamase superfamily)
MRCSALVLFALFIGPAWPADRVPARGGDIVITPITHASVQLEHGGKVIQVDPWSSGDYSNARAADLILITGAENDHFDLKAIDKIRKPGTVILIPAAASEKLPEGLVIANGETKTASGIRVDAIASYDLIPGDPFHPKGRGNGYIVTLGDKRVYLSGVTECVPEVQGLRNIDVAFVVMNSPNGRMTPSAAAVCVEKFKPKIVYPYHYRTCDVAAFKRLLEDKPVEVRLGNWYPETAQK